MDFRIGVIGFGSLVNNPHSEVYGRTLEVRRPRGDFPRPTGVRADSPFVLAEGLRLPTRLGRWSNEDTGNERLTLVLAEGASQEQVYVAESKFNNLNEAIRNLREREGIPESGKDNIGYVNLNARTKRSKITVVGARIEEWARQNRFNAVIWTDLPPKGVQFGANSTGREVMPLLQNNPRLLENTKKYIESLPTKNALQNEILALNAGLSPAAYESSLTADFPARDLLPQTDTPQADWFRSEFGKWGPMSKLYSQPEVPANVDAVQWKRDRIVEAAKKWTGLKYKRADGQRGHFPARGCGLDCSNFAAWVYNYALGIKITSDVDQLWSGLAGRKLGPNEPLQKGDLILLDGDPRHVVIYIDEHHVIDSTSGRSSGVQISDIRQNGSKWYTPNSSNPRFLGVKRFIE